MDQEPAIDGAVGGSAGIEIDWLYASPSFGITAWNCRTGCRGLSEEKAHHLWHAICFVHHGAFVLHSQGRSEVADRTTAILYNPGVPYRSSHPFGCSDHGSALVVRREVLLDVMSHFDPTAQERPGALFPVALGPDISQAYLRHRLLVRGLMQGAPADRSALEESLLAVLAGVARSSCRPVAKRAAAPESPRARRRYVHDAQLILQERFRGPCRLEDVARDLFVSPFHLCHLFRQEMGIPMHRYLNRLRLREALEQLADGADLTDLALSLGFAGHSHFTTAFRKEFGLTPSQVRRQASTALLAEMRKAIA